jgi:hypothetical protein
MPVEVPFNQTEINEREKRIEQSLAKFKDLLATRFNQEELSKINTALNLMLEIHLPQKDRADGKPFIQHPLEVASKVIEIGDKLTPDLVISALLHDSIEDMPEVIFAKRANKKFPNHNYKLTINEYLKKNYLQIFRDWSFREIDQEYGSRVSYYLDNLTNHDFDSLTEELPGLSLEEKNALKNGLYADHVKDIIKDPDLCLLKYADFSSNIDLSSLAPESEKYLKLKRKYASVILIFIDQLKKIERNHQLFDRKEMIIADLKNVYEQQYKSSSNV